MKVIILHGDHFLKSYQRLQKFLETARKRNWEILNDQIDLTPSLFGQERLYVIRKYRLFGPKEIKNLTKFPGTLVIYHEGIIPPTFIKSLPEPKKIEEFKLPKIIWGFLDSPSAQLLHKVIRQEPIEFVFTLLAKRFRDLYWVKTAPETIPYPAWQVAKLKKQALCFTQDKLKKIIEKLSEIDLKAKTSKADLLSSLDLLFLTKLE